MNLQEHEDDYDGLSGPFSARTILLINIVLVIASWVAVASLAYGLYGQARAAGALG